jgi:hypothetical protein
MDWSDVHPIADAPLPQRPGLYKVLLADAEGFADTCLTALETGALLYIGKAEKSLEGRDVRQHLSSERTGSSTLRRSLGAVLHDRLCLKARPRSDGRISNYRFDPEGEQHLTAWMLKYLSVSWLECASAAEAKAGEPALISELAPALNIDHNPRGRYVPLIQALRARCREEAAHDC